MPSEDRRTIGEDIKDVEFAWPIGLLFKAASAVGRQLHFELV